MLPVCLQNAFATTCLLEHCLDLYSATDLPPKAFVEVATGAKELMFASLGPKGSPAMPQAEDVLSMMKATGHHIDEALLQEAGSRPTVNV